MLASSASGRGRAHDVIVVDVRARGHVATKVWRKQVRVRDRRDEERQHVCGVEWQGSETPICFNSFCKWGAGLTSYWPFSVWRPFLAVYFTVCMRNRQNTPRAQQATVIRHVYREDYTRPLRAVWLQSTVPFAVAPNAPNQPKTKYQVTNKVERQST